MRLKLLIVTTAVILLSLGVFWMGTISRDDTPFYEPDSLLTEHIIEPQFLYGYRVDSMVVVQDFVKINQSISDILLPQNVSHQDIFDLANKSKGVFDVKKVKSGRPYTIILDPDSVVDKLVYESSLKEYVVFHMGDSNFVERVERKVDQVRKSLVGTITESLAVTIDDAGESVELTNKFVDVFAWQVDFMRLQKGDNFKIIYVENQVEGKGIGIESIEAIHFSHYGNDYWGFAYDQGEGIDYFDEDGNSLRKALLKYPLEFSRISSGYSLRRFHPIQKRYKPHLGTDFAALTGTPIRSVGDGIVTEAMFRQLNGNYVKIRHNNTYTTQYLHMSKIATGIKPGVKVKRGQLIGFVGATGLATGAHLCYRFWKNGVQVDAMKVELPPSTPIYEDHVEKFTQVKKSFIDELSRLSLENS